MIKYTIQQKLIQFIILILICLSYITLCLSPGMGSGNMVTTQDFLIDSVLITDQNVQKATQDNHYLVGDFDNGVHAILYITQDEKPVVIFTRSGEILTQNPPNSFSQKKSTRVQGVAADQNTLLVAYTGKETDLDNLNIYIAIIDISGDVILSDILIVNANGSDQIKHKLIKTFNNNNYFLVWESTAKTESDFSSIKGCTVKYIKDDTNPTVIGGIIDISTVTTANQKEPDLCLIQHLTEDPRKIAVSWSGIGDFYNFDTKQYISAMDFEDGTYFKTTTVKDYPYTTGNLANNYKPFYRILYLENNFYIPYPEYFSIINSFYISYSKENHFITGSNNFSIVTVTAMENLEILITSRGESSQASFMLKRSLIFSEENVLTIEKDDSGFQCSNGDQPFQYANFYGSNRIFLQTQYNGSTNKLNFQIPVLFELCQAAYGFTLTTTLETDHVSPLALTTSSAITSGYIFSTPDNKIYFSQYFYLQQNGCDSIDYCDLCHLDNEGQPTCTVCQGSTPEQRKMRFYQGQCPCNEVDYEIQHKDNYLDCQIKCRSPCKTCQSTSTNCLSCIIQDYRNTSLPCNCYNTYYDKEGVCVKCPSNCYNCESEIVCSTCVNSTNRNNPPTCDCKENYYQNESKQCTACIKPCLDCQSESQCLSCKGENMVLDGETGQCKCADNYFMDENKECQPCQAPCVNCKNLNECITCQDPLMETNNLNICICKQNYYENSESQCEKCTKPCQNCTSQGVCESCFDTKNMTLTDENTCICNDLYFMNSENICIECSLPCKKCSSDSICESCQDENAILTDEKTCICKDTYYLNDQNQCVQCQYPCLKCYNDLQCISCDSSDLILNDQNQCVCEQGKFFNTEKQLCELCPTGCQDCQNSETCQSCKNSEPQRITDKCLCPIGYFEDKQTLECLKCTNKCQACIYEEICLTCNTELQFRDQDNNCNCLYGYQEINGICIRDESIVISNETQLDQNNQQGGNNGSQQQCMFRCETCTNTEIDICLTCKLAVPERDINFNCACIPGYKDGDLNGDCIVDTDYQPIIKPSDNSSQNSESEQNLENSNSDTNSDNSTLITVLYGAAGFFFLWLLLLILIALYLRKKYKDRQERLKKEKELAKQISQDQETTSNIQTETQFQDKSNLQNNLTSNIGLFDQTKNNIQSQQNMDFNGNLNKIKSSNDLNKSKEMNTSIMDNNNINNQQSKINFDDYEENQTTNIDIPSNNNQNNINIDNQIDQKNQNLQNQQEQINNNLKVQNDLIQMSFDNTLDIEENPQKESIQNNNLNESGNDINDEQENNIEQNQKQQPVMEFAALDEHVNKISKRYRKSQMLKKKQTIQPVKTYDMYKPKTQK